MSQHKKQQALHWRVVGFVSRGAKKEIEARGGKIVPLSIDSELSLYAIAFASVLIDDGTMSSGQNEHRQGLEFLGTNEIQEASTGLIL